MNRPRTSIDELHALGQSVWLDDLRREMLVSGELRERIAAGHLRGMTSNPTIFEQGIGRSEVYSGDLRPLAQAGWSTERILDSLIADDIRDAADLFRPVYEESQGGDGFVSLEVHPALADETEATLEEVRRLWTLLNRPNVMIKIPATQAGIPAVRRAIAEGINVNITLIFSLRRYAEVIEAYLAGLEERRANGRALDHIASVASFFVSRVDSEVDERLDGIIRGEGASAERAASLRGQAAIANAQLAYAQFQAAFASERFHALESAGARVQRPLWASTSTKNPAYPDVYYIDNLIGPQTVNTMPLKTIEAFLDHGRPSQTLGENLSTARSRLEALASVGVSMDEVTDLLERQGVKKFTDSFVSLVKTVEGRAASARQEIEAIQPRLQATLDQLDRDDVGRRLWSRDGTLWPGEAAAWLGWLDLPEKLARQGEALGAFARQAAADGFGQAVVLGMGGSSLAADVLAHWNERGAGLDVSVLDTVEPSEVLERSRSLRRPLIIVASKSGTTVEPLSLMAYFRDARHTADEAFVAVTDPGTPLESLARERGFRQVFLAPPDVGGRYAALSVFGLLPAALAGVDLAALADGATSMARTSGPNIEAARNPGLFLGALLAAARDEGRDKVTLIADPPFQSMLAWIEQLLAESTGKDGKGLCPVVGEPPAAASAYGPDRLMIYLRVDGDHDDRVEKWVKAGIPVEILSLRAGPRDAGAEFLRWEIATAIACHLIGVNAFDQPDVEQAKEAARRALRARREGPASRAPAGAPSRAQDAPATGGIAAALADLQKGDVLAILAYAPRTPSVKRSLEGLRRLIRDRTKNATILGFGPGYLHSTGQLIKGGPERVVALFVYVPSGKDVPVPGVEYTLADLLRAQLTGDVEAMRSLGRRVHSIKLDSLRGLPSLTTAIRSGGKTSARRRRNG